MSLFSKIIIFLAVAAVTHLVVLFSLPGFIMSQARGKLAERGTLPYVWTASPRITPKTQTIVRASPDLSYAICLFDTRDGPVYIEVETWPQYASLSIFNAQTDNVSVLDLKGQPHEFGRVLLLRNVKEDVRWFPDAQRVEVSGQGIAIVRRLAPTERLHREAVNLISTARCELVEGS